MTTVGNAHPVAGFPSTTAHAPVEPHSATAITTTRTWTSRMAPP